MRNLLIAVMASGAFLLGGFVGFAVPDASAAEYLCKQNSKYKECMAKRRGVAPEVKSSEGEMRPIDPRRDVWFTWEVQEIVGTPAVYFSSDMGACNRLGQKGAGEMYFCHTVENTRTNVLYRVVSKSSPDGARSRGDMPPVVIYRSTRGSSWQVAKDFGHTGDTQIAGETESPPQSVEPPNVGETIINAAGKELRRFFPRPFK